MTSLVLHSGDVWCMDDADTRAEAVWLKDGRVAAVGKNDDVRAAAGPSAELIDLRGGTALPGIIDAHCHLASFGENRLSINAKALPSIAALQEAVAARARTLAPGTWIRGWGYNQDRLSEGRHPTRRDLDAAAKDHPVVITRTCGHILAANSLALKLAGIGDRDEDPEGGAYLREPDGTVSGVLLENAQRPVLRSSAPDRDELIDAIAAGAKAYAEAGITAIHDAGGPDLFLPALLDAVDRGLVALDVTMMIWRGLGYTQADRFLPTGLRSGFRYKNVAIGPFKIMIDGSSSGPTSRTREPYASGAGRENGIVYLSRERLIEDFKAAGALGWELTTHAIGDAAVEWSLDAIEAGGRPGLLHRIEHCAMCPPDLQRRVRGLGVTVAPQPAFLYEFGDGYLKNYGEERGGHMFPIGSWLRQGIPVAGSSDSPVTDHSPWRGMWAAMTRRSQGGAVLGPAERIGLKAAVAMYTRGGAAAAHQEAIRGQLRPGFAADVTVLPVRLEDLPVDEIPSIEVAQTIIGGEVVYSRS